MHVVCLGYSYAPDLRAPEDLLARYHVLTGWCNLLAASGVRVLAYQRFHRDAAVCDGEVEYRFVRDSLHPGLRKWEVPVRMHEAVRAHVEAKGADVVHVNGLIFPLPVRHLRRHMPQRAAIIAQDHANPPWSGPLARLQRWGLQAVDGFWFTDRSQADEWRVDRVIGEDKIAEVAGAWTSFTIRERAAARAQTGLQGAPVVLWVGNLTQNKDPLAVLAGFARIREHLSLARLYMAYGSAELLDTVESTIAQDARLAQSVTLLGAIAHDRIADYFNSADYFVLGSHREGSGFALVEAMACGCVPVVTNIPSFSRLTNSGAVGACWRPGDPASFAEAFLGAARKPLPQARREVMDHYAANLSYEAIGRRAVEAYTAALRSRESRTD